MTRKPEDQNITGINTLVKKFANTEGLQFAA